MNHTRRAFFKDAAVAGAVLSVAGTAEAGNAEGESAANPGETVRCPYFDQPMYCQGLTRDGKPLCDK